MQDNRFLPHELLSKTHMLNKTYSCNVWGLKLMHKNWVWKYYDQCVTCLADDRKTLEIHSSKPRTPETLSWTNNSIHKHSIIRCKGKTKGKDLNRKFKWRASICKKCQPNQSYETQTTIKRSSNSNLLEAKFKFSKSCSSCLSRRRGTRRRFWRWFHWIWINEQKIARVWKSGTNLR